MRARCLPILLGVLWALPCLGGWILDGQPLAPAGGGTSGGSRGVVVSVDEGTFPVLRLELGGRWTEFMLKASTDNFATVVYEVVSAATNAAADDTNVWVYFCDDYRPDSRGWIRATNAVPIGEQLADAVNSEVTATMVFPSHECAVDWQGWMTRTNSRLVWSYTRMDGAEFEMNSGGTRVHWSPVVPVAWVKERTTP